MSALKGDLQHDKDYPEDLDTEGKDTCADVWTVSAGSGWLSPQ
jgi:hypothetical protein